MKAATPERAKAVVAHKSLQSYTASGATAPSSKLGSKTRKRYPYWSCGLRSAGRRPCRGRGDGDLGQSDEGDGSHFVAYVEAPTRTLSQGAELGRNPDP